MIALAWPAARVSLIESKAKKASFLDEARRQAGCASVQVCNDRIEDLAAEASHAGAYDVVTARALASLPEVVRLARPLLAPGGQVIAMRAVHEPAEGAVEIADYALPDGTRRRLAICA